MTSVAIPAFVWKVDGVGVNVELSTPLLSQLHAALNAEPENIEFGGILLGKIASGSSGDSDAALAAATFRTKVDAFEPFPIEHRHGENYALSLRDRIALERRLKRLRRKGLVPVGFYRSHLRRGMYLDQRDFETFQADFRHPAAIFLLIRRDALAGARGALFVWEEEDMRRHTSYREFQLPEAPPVPVAPAQPAGGIRVRMRLAPAALQIVARSFGKGIDQFPAIAASRARAVPQRDAPDWSRLLEKRLATAAPQAGPQKETPAKAAPRTAAREWGKRLEEWLPVREVSKVWSGMSSASGTTVKIALTLTLPLLSFYAAREIALSRSGAPKTDQVRTVSRAPSNSSPEETAKPDETPHVPPSLAAVQPSTIDGASAKPGEQAQDSEPVNGRSSGDGNPRPQASQSVDSIQPSAQSGAPVAVPDPRRLAAPKGSAASNARNRFDVQAASNRPSEAKTEQTATMLPEPPAVHPAALAVTVPRIVAAQPTPPRQGPSTVVAFMKPVQPSSIRGAIGKVPLLREFAGRNTADQFVPASPIDYPLPAQPLKTKELEKGSMIEMMAKVDQSGNVMSVKVVDGNRRLADTSAESILRWRFEPARQNGSPVESSMRIRFEFRNPPK